jgi:molybdate transport system substrate-binding protein
VAARCSAFRLRIPPEVQRVTMFSAGIAARATAADASRALIAFLQSAAAAPGIAKSGLEPVTAR